MADKKTVLFVDDEQKVLDGVRRMLYTMRPVWDMQFFNSAKSALEYMKTAHVDVVVSDMRMPEMDGAEFLSTVKKLYPDTIRFILSGYSDQQMILKTIGSTDQFLTKPCNPDELKTVISKALESQDIVDDNKIRAFVSRLDSLPTMPNIYTELKELLESPESSFAEVAKVVSKDISMTAKVLQLVNSAFFGLRHHVTSIQQAVTYLGFETIKAVVLATGIFSKYTKEEIDKFGIEDTYDHSIGVGMIASKIVKKVTGDEKMADEAGMAGILHDIGKLIFIRNKPDDYEGIMKKVREEGANQYIIEQDNFGVNHAEIGGYLMGLWALPQNIVNSITFHHNPKKFEHSSFEVLTAIYVSNILEQRTLEQLGGPLESFIDLKYLEKISIRDKFSDWVDMAVEIKKRREEEREESE